MKVQEHLVDDLWTTRVNHAGVALEDVDKRGRKCGVLRGQEMEDVIHRAHGDHVGAQCFRHKDWWLMLHDGEEV